MANLPKPTALKKIEGTYRKDRAPKNEVTPTIPISLLTPNELNEDGQWLWQRIVAEYLPVGLLTTVDEGSLKILCNEYGTYMDADDLIKAKGLEVSDSNGNIVANPMLKVRNDSFKNYNSLCTKFGITPSDRARLSAPEQTAKDSFAEFDN